MEWITEESESDTRTSYPVTEVLWRGQTPSCSSVIIGDSPVFGKMLFLDGELQSAAADEHIYHETLVHPVMGGAGRGKRVLVVGGGEGATVREVLRWNPSAVDWVDIDVELVNLCRDILQWAPDVYTNPVVRYHGADIREVLPTLALYDVIILDLPDPDGDTGYLYSPAFWQDMLRHLSPFGRMVTHCGPVKPFGGVGDGVRRIRDTTNTANVVFSKSGFYSQMIPSFQSEWGFWMYVNSPNDSPFGFRGSCNLPQELKVVDNLQLEYWAKPTFMWRMALVAL
jgi:spermidine synthase